MAENKATAIVPVREVKEPQLLTERFADKYGIARNDIVQILVNTAFRVKGGITNAQVAALMLICEKYDLDPFAREVYAFVKDGAVFPLVGVDAWTKIANRQPTYKGRSVRYSDEEIKIGNMRVEGPKWVEATIYDSRFSQPIVKIEKLAENYRPDNPNWNTMPTRMLYHRAFAQAIRETYGISGLYDPDDMTSILAGTTQIIDAHAEPSIVPTLSAKLEQRRAAIEAPKEQPTESELTPDPGAVQAAAKAKEKDKATEYKRGRGLPPAARQEVPPLNDVGTPPEQPDLLGGREPGDDDEEWPPVTPPKE